MKRTSDGGQNQNIKSGISQQPLIGSSSNFKLKFCLKFKMKMTSDGRRPQNIKSGTSQPPLIGSSSNFKLKLRGPNQNEIWLEI
jgi:hypothetical protein